MRRNSATALVFFMAVLPPAKIKRAQNKAQDHGAFTVRDLYSWWELTCNIDEDCFAERLTLLDRGHRIVWIVCRQILIETDYGHLLLDKSAVLLFLSRTAVHQGAEIGHECSVGVRLKLVPRWSRVPAGAKTAFASHLCPPRTSGKWGKPKSKYFSFVIYEVLLRNA